MPEPKKSVLPFPAKKMITAQLAVSRKRQALQTTRRDWLSRSEAGKNCARAKQHHSSPPRENREQRKFAGTEFAPNAAADRNIREAKPERRQHGHGFPASHWNEKITMSKIHKRSRDSPEPVGNQQGPGIHAAQADSL